MEYKIGTIVKYKQDEYSIDNITHNISDNTYILHLKNNDKIIIVSDNDKDIEYTDEINENIINIDDKVLYNDKEYFVSSKFNNPFDSSMYWIGLYNKESGIHIKVDKNNCYKIEKIKNDKND